MEGYKLGLGAGWHTPLVDPRKGWARDIKTGKMKPLYESTPVSSYHQGSASIYSDYSTLKSDSTIPGLGGQIKMPQNTTSYETKDMSLEDQGREGLRMRDPNSDNFLSTGAALTGIMADILKSGSQEDKKEAKDMLEKVLGPDNIRSEVKLEMEKVREWQAPNYQNHPNFSSPSWPPRYPFEDPGGFDTLPVSQLGWNKDRRGLEGSKVKTAYNLPVNESKTDSGDVRGKYVKDGILHGHEAKSQVKFGSNTPQKHLSDRDWEEKVRERSGRGNTNTKAHSVRNREDSGRARDDRDSSRNGFVDDLQVGQTPRGSDDGEGREPRGPPQ
jgi:hypothetical protein